MKRTLAHAGRSWAMRLTVLGVLTTFLAVGASAEVLHPSISGSQTSSLMPRYMDSDFHTFSFNPNFSHAPWVGDSDEGSGTHFDFFTDPDGHKFFHDDDDGKHSPTPEPTSEALLLSGLFGAGLLLARRVRAR
jgi:hypothetical protein